MLKAAGLQPDGIVGHSVGEVACGYADESLSHEEAILAAYWRGKCVKDGKLPPGGMAAVGRYTLVKRVIQKSSSDLFCGTGIEMCWWRQLL